MMNNDVKLKNIRHSLPNILEYRTVLLEAAKWPKVNIIVNVREYLTIISAICNICKIILNPCLVVERVLLPHVVHLWRSYIETDLVEQLHNNYINHLYVNTIRGILPNHFLVCNQMHPELHNMQYIHGQRSIFY